MVFAVHGGPVVSELGLWASILLTYYAVKTKYRHVVVNLALHRKMGGLVKDFDTQSVVMGFNPK